MTPAEPTAEVVEALAGTLRQSLTAKLAYSVPEAAAIIGISPRFAWDLVGRGELPSKRLGRRVLVPVVALERFLDAVDVAS